VTCCDGDGGDCQAKGIEKPSNRLGVVDTSDKRHSYLGHLEGEARCRELEHLSILFQVVGWEVGPRAHLGIVVAVRLVRGYKAETADIQRCTARRSQHAEDNQGLLSFALARRIAAAEGRVHKQSGSGRLKRLTKVETLPTAVAGAEVPEMSVAGRVSQPLLPYGFLTWQSLPVEESKIQ
jgi:hypothetical protein